ncbi:MAG TPA: hypothetical protein VFB21_10725 [Chthonomonadaceae bacterium]|nr:hypothetical protein [Chthonomonadaceae bacterium]
MRPSDPAAWLLIEFVIPAVAFLLYWLIRRMLSRAVNDKRDCQGRLLRSLSWGAFWASLYTAPLALLVWALHLVLRHGA